MGIEWVHFLQYLQRLTPHAVTKSAGSLGSKFQIWGAWESRSLQLIGKNIYGSQGDLSLARKTCESCRCGSWLVWWLYGFRLMCKCVLWFIFMSSMGSTRKSWKTTRYLIETHCNRRQFHDAIIRCFLSRMNNEQGDESPDEISLENPP